MGGRFNFPVTETPSAQALVKVSLCAWFLICEIRTSSRTALFLPSLRFVPISSLELRAQSAIGPDNFSSKSTIYDSNTNDRKARQQCLPAVILSYNSMYKIASIFRLRNAIAHGEVGRRRWENGKRAAEGGRRKAGDGRRGQRRSEWLFRIEKGLGKLDGVEGLQVLRFFSQTYEFYREA